MRIVSDSSANVRGLHKVSFRSVPLKILAGGKEYVDDASLDAVAMIDEMEAGNLSSSTACPGIDDWTEAFGDEEEILGLALTSRLSGCYNSGAVAARDYMNDHPGRKAFILDTLSTGPEMELIIEEYERLIEAGHSYEQICEKIVAYLKRTSLLFILGSLNNFARNGRVPAALAKITGVLNIHIVGRASAEGELEPLSKCPGLKRSISQLWKQMQQSGYCGGKVRIRHTRNAESASRLAELIRSAHPAADILIGENGGLCSYYAEKGGVLVGFERGEATV